MSTVPCSELECQNRRTKLAALKALCSRWNRAAEKAGFGAEYLDEPERVFEQVAELRDQLRKLPSPAGMVKGEQS